MKKTFTILFLVALLLNSCTHKQSSSEIDISKLKTQCDYLNALYTCLVDLGDKAGERTEVTSFTSDEKEQIGKIIEKITIIGTEYKRVFYGPNPDPGTRDDIEVV